MYVRTIRVAVAVVVLMVASALGAKAAAASPFDAQVLTQQAVGRAIDFLQKAQASDGSYAAANGPGVTAVVTVALLRHGRTPNDPLVADARILDELLESCLPTAQKEET